MGARAKRTNTPGTAFHSSIQRLQFDLHESAYCALGHKAVGCPEVAETAYRQVRPTYNRKFYAQNTCHNDKDPQHVVIAAVSASWALTPIRRHSPSRRRAGPSPTGGNVRIGMECPRHESDWLNIPRRCRVRQPCRDALARGTRDSRIVGRVNPDSSMPGRSPAKVPDGQGCCGRCFPWSRGGFPQRASRRGQDHQQPDEHSRPGPKIAGGLPRVCFCAGRGSEPRSRQMRPGLRRTRDYASSSWQTRCSC